MAFETRSLKHIGYLDPLIELGSRHGNEIPSLKQILVLGILTFRMDIQLLPAIVSCPTLKALCMASMSGVTDIWAVAHVRLMKDFLAKKNPTVHIG